jgi:hypothetical protein
LLGGLGATQELWYGAAFATALAGLMIIVAVWPSEGVGVNASAVPETYRRSFEPLAPAFHSIMDGYRSGVTAMAAIQAVQSRQLRYDTVIQAVQPERSELRGMSLEMLVSPDFMVRVETPSSEQRGDATTRSTSWNRKASETTFEVDTGTVFDRFERTDAVILIVDGPAEDAAGDWRFYVLSAHAVRELLSGGALSSTLQLSAVRAAGFNPVAAPELRDHLASVLQASRDRDVGK